MSMSEQAIAKVRSAFRGHPIIWWEFKKDKTWYWFPAKSKQGVINLSASA